MSAKSPKTVTIGVTVNLENYENLRVEVSDEVETQQGADGLVAFLDGMLSRLGRNDPVTASRIDHYRRRVLSHRNDNGLPDKSPDDVLPFQEPVEPAIREAVKTGADPYPPATPPAAPVKGEEACEQCGAGITASQAKMTRLFANRPLCKGCYDRLAQGGSA
ncbi:hypothetical protein DSECCO2_213040 [anaerobic digester metagenome]